MRQRKSEPNALLIVIAAHVSGKQIDAAFDPFHRRIGHCCPVTLAIRIPGLGRSACFTNGRSKRAVCDRRSIPRGRSHSLSARRIAQYEGAAFRGFAVGFNLLGQTRHGGMSLMLNDISNQGKTASNVAVEAVSFSGI